MEAPGVQESVMHSASDLCAAQAYSAFVVAVTSPPKMHTPSRWRPLALQAVEVS